MITYSIFFIYKLLCITQYYLMMLTYTNKYVRLKASKVTSIKKEFTSTLLRFYSLRKTFKNLL